MSSLLKFLYLDLLATVFPLIFISTRAYYKVSLPEKGLLGSISHQQIPPLSLIFLCCKCLRKSDLCFLFLFFSYIFPPTYHGNCFCQYHQKSPCQFSYHFSVLMRYSHQHKWSWSPPLPGPLSHWPLLSLLMIPPSLCCLGTITEPSWVTVPGFCLHLSLAVSFKFRF